MKKPGYLLLFIILSIVFTGCSLKESPEKAVNHIIETYNTKNIIEFWERSLPEDRFAVSKSMINNISNTDLFTLMGFALNRDNVTADNITAEEYFYAMFKLVLGSKEMELKNLEKINDNKYNANILVGEKQAVIPLIRENGRWYMKMEN